MGSRNNYETASVFRVPPRFCLPAVEGDFIFQPSEAAWRAACDKVGKTNADLLHLVARCYCAILSDSPIGLKPRKVLLGFIKKFLSDPFAAIALFDKLSLQLQKSVKLTDQDTLMIEPLYGAFKDTPVFKEYHMFVANFDPRVMSYLLSFLSFAKKVEWDVPDLESSALRAWLDLEKRLGAVTVPSWSKDLRTVLTYLTRDWSKFCFYPRHGGGAVAERLRSKTPTAKCDILSLPPKVARAYFRPEMSHPFAVEIDHSIAKGTVDFRHLMLNDGSRELVADAAKLMFVPKSYKAVRSICMEPTAYQYAQQSVEAWMTKNMADSKVIRRFVRLNDQSFNQIACRVASKMRDADTIDLSSASDSVKWELVRAFFPSKVLFHLHATRSTAVVLPGGRIVKPHKFAPMGSATCFPVQTMLYLGLALLAGLRVESATSPITPARVAEYCKRIGGKGGHTCLRVFGDDIICDSQVTSELISLLDQAGFVVNTDKSFYSGEFYRESCGVHAFNGDDVTYFQLKSKPLLEGGVQSITSLGSSIDAANRAYKHHYINVRNELVRHCLQTPIFGVRKRNGINPILFVQDGDEETSFALWSQTPHNSHLQLRDPEPSDETSATKCVVTSDKLKSLSASGVHALRHCSGSTATLYQRKEVQSVHGASAERQKVPMRTHWYYYDVRWRELYKGERSEDSGSVYDTALLSYSERALPNTVPLTVGPAMRWTPWAG